MNLFLLVGMKWYSVDQSCFNTCKYRKTNEDKKSSITLPGGHPPPLRPSHLTFHFLNIIFLNALGTVLDWNILVLDAFYCHNDIDYVTLTMKFIDKISLLQNVYYFHFQSGPFTPMGRRLCNFVLFLRSVLYIFVDLAASRII